MDSTTTAVRPNHLTAAHNNNSNHNILVDHPMPPLVLTTKPSASPHASNVSDPTAPSSSSSLTSLIKVSDHFGLGTVEGFNMSNNLNPSAQVSPLKSLLREDLKRRISARASNRSTRASTANNTTSSSSSNHTGGISASNASAISHNNSTTSQQQQQLASATNPTSNASSKANSGANTTNHHSSSGNNSNTTASATTNERTSNANNSGATDLSSMVASMAAAAAAAAAASQSTVTSNGTITSTGADTEMALSSAARRRMLQCLFCGIEFPDQTLYFLHKGCHSESNPWKCNICGEQLGNVYEFNSHLLSKSHQ